MLCIEGIVEDIVFRNEENGYTVAHFKEKEKIHTIVGTMPYIMNGQNLRLSGEWVIHSKFGQQFKVYTYEEIIPNTIEGIERYLSSGVISGIGSVTAKKIVEKFKENTLEILDNDIDRLREINGIGKRKIEIIKDSYEKQKEVKNIMVFLQTYGVTPSQCVKIYNKYGKDSINIVKNNPYVLIEDISGIGFKTADKLARSLGIDKESPFRIQSGIKYVVNEFCSIGNTYMPLEKLLEEAKRILSVSTEIIEKNVYDCVLDNKIKIEKIDGVDCVFSLLLYYCELSVTKKIITLSLCKYENLDIDVCSEIQDFEKENNIKFSESQREAIEGAMNSGIEIITGGPGTGKTTIINCITQIFQKIGMKVFMAAPTGRAAKRMEEATHHEAKTIHRLLEIGFRGEDEDEYLLKDEENILECDVVIIDEASMVDIILMNNLLKAIGLGTRVIIVGDVDQLPSVGPGNVLKDIIESKCVKVVRLKEIFRQGKESMIIVNAHRINQCKMPQLNVKNNDFYFIKKDDRNKILDTIVELVSTRLPKFNSKWNNLKDIQVLSPMRRGILGVENINQKLQRILNPPSKDKKEKVFRNLIFREGDKVMQTKNNYTLKWNKVSNDEEGTGIFNGDIGFIEKIDDEENEMTIIFDEEKRVKYDSMHFDELTLAYSITIHKSQGSEFPVVIIPVFLGPPLLMNKNLLYTGITRAKKLVVLVGTTKALNFMVNNDRSFERYSSLKWRINNVLQ